jgi:uncharacterized protein DUF1186/SEC-C motif-containing protein
MEMQELLARLDQHEGSFPHALVEEIIGRREEATPRLLEVLEDIDRNPEPWLADHGRMIHIYALYLLAFFRETRAYPLLVRIFSRPGEFPFELVGDVVTESLGRILASVSDGEIKGMAALIENEQANEWVRWVAMTGLVTLVVTGQRTREEIMAYFLQLFHHLERKPGMQWTGLAHACADLGPQEAITELRRAYADDLVDPGSIHWRDIERALELGQFAWEQAQRRHSLITDLARAMGWMQCFRKAERGYPRQAASQPDLPLPSSVYATTPVRRTTPKIGRNEPCPCGSGKKSKKCCGANTAVLN